MFFRNLTFFRFPTSLDLSQLNEFLPECQLKPVGPLEMSSRGFISPFSRDETACAHQIGDSIWLAVGGEDKILPSAVINDLLGKKLAELEKAEGRKPGGRTRKRIKEDMVHELLPRAFVKPSRTDALVDLQHGFIAVDIASRKVAATVVSQVRAATGSFPALPLNTQVAPRSVLTGWIAGEPMPDGLALGEECELRDAMDDGGKVRITDMALQSEEIETHLEAGKQCTRLALVLDDHLSFVLGEDMVVRKLKFLDGAVDQLEQIEREDLRAELDARFALMGGEVKRLFLVLEAAFKVSPADDSPPPRDRVNQAARAAVQSFQDTANKHGATVTISAFDRSTGKEETLLEIKPQGKRGDEPLYPDDPLYSEAVAQVRLSGRASISGVQRVLKIGYNRAAHLIEAMESKGIVSAPDRAGNRTVLPHQ